MSTGEVISNFSESGIRDAMVSNSSEAMKFAISEIVKKMMPFLEIIGGLIGVYIIILIIKLISDLIFKRRIKRIDRNLQEILEILKGEHKKHDKKSK